MAASEPEGSPLGWHDDPTWWSGVLGAPVDAVTVTPLDVGGVSGRLARARLRYRAGGPAGPGRVVIKAPTADPGTRARQARLGMFAREVAFYRRWAAAVAERAAIRTPHCWYAGDDGTLVLDDLSPAPFGTYAAGLAPREMASVVDAMARLHASWWDAPGLAAEPDLWHTTEAAADAAAGVHRDRWPSFAARVAGLVDPAELARAEHFVEEMVAVLVASAAGRLTLAHGDLGPPNLCFAPDGDGALAAVIDWQLVGHRSGPVDLAWLVVLGLQPEVRRSVQADLLERYHRGLQRGGVTNYSLAELAADFRVGVRITLRAPVFLLGAPVALSSPYSQEYGVAALVRSFLANAEQ